MVEASKELGPWRKKVAEAAKEVVGEDFQLIEKPIPVYIQLTFVLPRPKSTPTNQNPPATKRPDVDKLARAILDALTGVVYQDDSQVTELILYKAIAIPGEESGVHVVIKH